MPRSSRLSKHLVLAFVVAPFALVGWQTPDAKLDDVGLKAMLTGFGYEVKEPGAGVYELKMEAAGLNIPTRVFIAKSKSKVWLSVALMQKDGVDKLTREELRTLLEKNVDVGPCHFMIESGWLKLKMVLDNRGITPVVLRSELDYLAARIGDSKAVWQQSAP